MPKRTKSKRPSKYVYEGDPLTEPPPPELSEILDRHRGRRDALITVLEEIQHHYGFLPKRALQYTARELHFPLAQVFGVATFYNLFQFTPPGRYIVRVCEGTACHVNGSTAILDHLKEKLGIDVDETTDDEVFTLQSIACMGACSLAPVIVVNDHTHGRMGPDSAWAALDHLRGEVTSPNGQPKEDTS